ncbi:MAG: PQQ-binding-like beta-propeller repeat protein [Paludibacteraceae bacterium]
MKRSLFFAILLWVVVPVLAQPSFRGKGDEIRREDFPVERDRTPINAMFSFAIFSDLHVCDTLPQNLDDLQRAIDEVNNRADLAFVLVCGDVTHHGDTKSLRLAKQMLDGLRIPYYVVPGNHDMRVSESGAVDFARIFGDNHFRLFFNGYLFLGVNSSPVLRRNDAHVSPQELAWLTHHLKKAGRKQPVYVVLHHPLQNGDVDNWYAVTDLLRGYNLQGVFCGHYHRNAVLDFDGITGVVVRSTLRENNAVGGYTVCDMADSLYFAEKRIGEPAHRWYALPLDARIYTESNERLFPRPNYDVNKQYKNVKVVWQRQLDWGIYGSAVVADNRLFVGDDSGMMRCFDLVKGKQLWQYKTAQRIAAAPMVARNKVLFGSGDNNIYCLDATDGRLLWKCPTGQAVCATPIVVDDVAFVGSGDANMRAVNVESGAVLWGYNEPKGFIQTAAAVCGNNVVFGAHDKTLYAVDATFGNHVWQCALPGNPTTAPYVAGEQMFVVTDNGRLVAVDVANGQIVWQSPENEKFIASLALSADGRTLYARTNKGRFYAIDATIKTFDVRWKREELYAADTNPCAIGCDDRMLVFATRNGLIIALDATDGHTLWQHKVGNTGVNAIVPIGADWLLTTLDGLVVRLTIKK